MMDPTDRLLTATRRRLFVTTLGLVALLVVGIGAATTVTGLGALDADVDRALDATVKAALVRLGGELPAADESSDSEELPPAASDTFLLYLDAGGRLVSNPSRVSLGGLPNAVAVAGAATTGRDLRSVDSDGVPVRLLTVSVQGEGGAPVGYVQAGFVLTLRDRQAASLVAAIVLVGIVGLIGAGLVTLLVTGRALVPIRRTFEAQRRFVADASHELRTPVALIRANAEVLEREALVPAGGRPLVDDIVAEADRLTRLVGDLLALEATAATGLPIQRRPVDLATLAHETARNATALAAKRQVQVAVAAPLPAFVNGDPDRLVQLLVILLDNALDHSPQGGTITVAVRRTGRTVELTVADQGPGIPVAERERIFEPFTRLPGVRRDGAGGTGLGLAIARRIALAHDATIVVDDADGGGARFVVAMQAAERGTA